ncbi:HAD family phosphatase [Deinococcus sp.]|uniref:HAD family hydrolase n=1 Tax=Deinococcus sp. TaxID=47478 RepID=UPI0025EB655D|nr:HAD family phosphatase [Deinococcus sp.]
MPSAATGSLAHPAQQRGITTRQTHSGSAANAQRLRSTLPSMTFEAILFDMDGVLVDSEVLTGEIWRSALHEHGLTLDAPSYMAMAVGLTVPGLYTALEREHGWQRPAPFEAHLNRRLGEAFASVQEVPGAALLLGALQTAHLPFAVASNSERERLHLKLGAAGLSGLVGEHAYDPTCVGLRGKPLPDLYLYAARQLGADIRQCLVVEDSLTGLAAGLSAGATVWAFTGGAHGVDGAALVAAGAERALASHAELRRLLNLPGITSG